MFIVIINCFAYFYVQLATENKKSAPVIRTDADYLYTLYFILCITHRASLKSR